MELLKDGQYLVSKEEYEFLQEAKFLLGSIRNRWFADGRRIDQLFKKGEVLYERQNNKHN